MLVVFRSVGRFSNRLFQNLHFEAFCLEHGIPFANPTFANMRKYYSAPVASPLCATAWLLRRPGIAPLLRLSRAINIVTFDADTDSSDPAKLAALLAGDCYVEGWCFRVHQLTVKHRHIFRERYALKESYYKDNPLVARLAAIDRHTQAVVGVHVRRGDYEFFAEGKYYFGDQVYRSYMKTLADQLADCHAKQAVFVIFSNEETSFKDTADTIVSREQWYLDHHLMSLCDYLIGPPSSFTGWASYMGDTPLYYMEVATPTFRLDDFQIMSG